MVDRSRLKLGTLYNQAKQTIRGLQFPADRAVHIVQYAHETGGNFYNATISDVDGPVTATWSYDEEGERVTRDRLMDPTVFGRLWSEIETLPVFRGAFTEQMNRGIDLWRDHIVTLITSRPGEVRRAIYLVPADTADAEFAAWLGMLGRPDQPPTDAERAWAVQSVDDAVDELVGQVVADPRWNDQGDSVGVEVLAMLVYGLALKVASHRMFASGDGMDAAVTRALAERAGMALEQSSGLLDAARRASFDPHEHPGHYELIYVGTTYFEIGRSSVWPAVVDHVFAQIAHVRNEAGGAPATG